ncbi:hypothetical protein GGS23DRAFT_339484 [Durotheca rogersii]|uniref:uncharacterized protein n=1 Tax=Durotheca rogersii TaxID=419775 RepID=UPI0022200FE3|nr:uncharacterized protein GGS23DRAFT_339484 [Durotheca rogersii]KAI5858222.1 hypothetical protein GGS23DRAFT_339484 [Durotheca rogersii]
MRETPGMRRSAHRRINLRVGLKLIVIKMVCFVYHFTLSAGHFGRRRKKKKREREISHRSRVVHGYWQAGMHHKTPIRSMSLVGTERGPRFKAVSLFSREQCWAIGESARFPAYGEISQHRALRRLHMYLRGAVTCNSRPRTSSAFGDGATLPLPVARVRTQGVGETAKQIRHTTAGSGSSGGCAMAGAGSRRSEEY